MHSQFLYRLWPGCLLLLAVVAAQSPSPVESAAPAAFTYNATTFLLHGKPYQIIGGQMDPQRIPYQYWRDRLTKARAMGLNTIFSYVFWDQLEPQQGNWQGHTLGNNVASYFKIAQEEGLNVVLRPGPYICGEHEWGGFPAWLSEIPGLRVRENNAPFLEASKSYIQNLAADLKDHQITNGGPILMVQVENEYGSYGDDHTYTEALRDILRENFQVPLYTTDGGEASYLEGGSIHDVLASADGDPQSDFTALRALKDPTKRGPSLDGEYYTTWLDLWGSDYPHQQPSAAERQQVVEDIEYILGNQSASVNFYMVHGGTNFGYENGGLWQDKTMAVTTSYDYGAPIDESGRTTELYHDMRDAIAKYGGILPDVPADIPRLAVPEFELSPSTHLFNMLGGPTGFRRSPVPMEELGQAHGFILYSHTATSPIEGVVHPGDRARDRVLVYVNGAVQGVIDSTYKAPKEVSVSLKKGDNLQLFVENLGRIDYWNQRSGTPNQLHQPHKGVTGDITIGGTTVYDWSIHSIPLDSQPPQSHYGRAGSGYGWNNPSGAHQDTPLFFHGNFTVAVSQDADPRSLDTYLSLPQGVKGNVWVNGVFLGKYWLIGPQQSLYVPGTLIKSGSNDVVVLELEPNQMKGEMTAVGLADRMWFNQPDVDCMSCT